MEDTEQDDKNSKRELGKRGMEEMESLVKMMEVGGGMRRGEQYKEDERRFRISITLGEIAQSSHKAHVKGVVEGNEVAVSRNPPEGKVHCFCRNLLVLTVTDNNIC